MATAKSGDKIQVHYTGKLEDGTTFDSSAGREPLQFQLGEGQVIPGFDQGIIGMEYGEKKTITIPPEQAYGDRRDDLVTEVESSVFPEEVKPAVGAKLQMELKDGNKIPVEITAIEGEKVTLDANHPLAGKTLIFEVELVETSKPE